VQARSTLRRVRAAPVGERSRFDEVLGVVDELVELARLVDGGKLNPAIDFVYPLADARAAFERSITRGKSGKVVLRVSDE